MYSHSVINLNPTSDYYISAFRLFLCTILFDAYKVTKKYKATTNSKHNLPVADNILNQNFKAGKPNEKWVSDITYIPTREGWLYLAGVMDLYSRGLVGWAMDSRMKTELVSSAPKQAIGRTGAKEGLIVHSDRGVQYASNEY